MSERTIPIGPRSEAAERSLGLIAELISQPSHWSSWLAEDTERSVLLAEASESVDRLAKRTGWPTHVALRQLGCRKRKAKELREMTIEQLRRCHEYFGWVEELTELVDRQAEQRRTLEGAARLFRDTSGDLVAARQATSEGSPSGLELLRLGEIESAFENPKERTWSDSRTHLRGKRIDRFLDAEDESISTEMRKRIALHISECNLCSQAVAERKNRHRNPQGSH